MEISSRHHQASLAHPRIHPQTAQAGSPHLINSIRVHQTKQTGSENIETAPCPSCSALCLPGRALFPQSAWEASLSTSSSPGQADTGKAKGSAIQQQLSSEISSAGEVHSHHHHIRWWQQWGKKTHLPPVPSLCPSVLPQHFKTHCSLSSSPTISSTLSAQQN